MAQNLVPWMSGSVSGLQNRARRFESARNLHRGKKDWKVISDPFLCLILWLAPNEQKLYTFYI